jgi:hypothetical protein
MQPRLYTRRHFLRSLHHRPSSRLLCASCGIKDGVAISVAQRALSITQRALTVTQRALDVTQGNAPLLPAAASASTGGDASRPERDCSVARNSASSLLGVSSAVGSPPLILVAAAGEPLATAAAEPPGSSDSDSSTSGSSSVGRRRVEPGCRLRLTPKALSGRVEKSGVAVSLRFCSAASAASACCSAARARSLLRSLRASRCARIRGQQVNTVQRG